jgi:hypothetical protein
LIAVDDYCHRYGLDSSKLDEACAAMDRNLGLLLEAAGEQQDVLLFSDHGQMSVHTHLTPNEVLVEMGHLLCREDGYHSGESGCFIECCGGSAFFHAGTLEQQYIDEVRLAISQSRGFDRFLTDAEMCESGYSGHAAFGFAAQSGYCYDAYAGKEKANHGYPLDTPGYGVFYMHRGAGVESGVTQGGSLLDITPLVASRLGIDWGSEGRQ